MNLNKKTLAMVVNGKTVEKEVKPGDTLLDVLRNELGLKGVKKGCGKGECGACTVIMNGKAVNSCIVPAMQAEGADIQTIEGLSNGNGLYPLQQTFVDCGAIQCGFCTPGMIMSGKALLDKNLNPTKQEIKQALAGNVCRCTGFVKIEEAVEKAAEILKNGK